MPRLILTRHGNTFAPDERAVWLGPWDDPPLVLSGEQQARRLAGALRRAHIVPAELYCGPLRRMRQLAEIVSDRLNLKRQPIVDGRLTEIDYGGWTGLSNEQVIERFGVHEFRAWYEGCVWPAAPAWNSDEGAFRTAVRRFIDFVTNRHGIDETVVAVTSHGVLKCLGRQPELKPATRAGPGRHRVDTGNICELICTAQGVRVLSWNRSPDHALKDALTV